MNGNKITTESQKMAEFVCLVVGVDLNGETIHRLETAFGEDEVEAAINCLLRDYPDGFVSTDVLEVRRSQQKVLL